LDDEAKAAQGWQLLAVFHSMSGQAEESLTALHRSLAIEPTAARHSTLLLGMQYVDGAEPEPLLAAHRQWDAAYARPLLPATPPAIWSSAGDRPLRIGLISADFGRHPIGFLALPALEHLDRKECSLICYSDRLGQDQYMVRFKAAAD